MRWTPLAVSHLRAVYDYIAGESDVAAEAILERIFSAVEFLERHPDLGRAGRVAGTRELVVSNTPLIGAYRKRVKSLDILAVLHGARRCPENF